MQRLVASRIGAAGGARQRALSTQTTGSAQGKQPRILKAGIRPWLFLGVGMFGVNGYAVYRMYDGTLRCDETRSARLH